MPAAVLVARDLLENRDSPKLTTPSTFAAFHRNPEEPFRRGSETLSRTIQKLESCCLTVVIIEQPAESLAASHCPGRSSDGFCWNNEAVVESLMIPFQMVMRHK